MDLALIMVVIYLAATTGISLYFAKRNAGSESYFAAGRSLGTVMVITLLFSEIIAGSGTIGNAASGFTTGFSSVWYNWGMAVGCFLFVALVGRFYRAMAVHKKVMTVPQAYYYMFDQRTQVLMVFILVIAYVIMYSTQATSAASILAPMLGVDQRLVTWAITALFILTTCTGGMKGIAWMNAVHAIVMYAGMFIVCFKCLSSVGGMEALHAALPETYFSFAQPDLPTTVASALGTGISFLAASNVTACTFSARDQKTANRGILLGGLLVIPFALAPSIIGICARVVMPGVAPNSAIYAMAESMGSGYGGLVSMAILAAIWSTGPTLLLIICTSLTRDLYKNIRPQATEKQELAFSRICAVVIGVVGSGLGMGVASILNQMLGAFQIRSVVGIVLAVALFWPRVSPSAAFWSMLGGGIVAAVWQFGGKPFGWAPLWPAAAVTLLILIPMTLLSKEKVSAGYKLYKAALADMDEREPKKGKRTRKKENVNLEV